MAAWERGQFRSRLRDLIRAREHGREKRVGIILGRRCTAASCGGRSTRGNRETFGLHNFRGAGFDDEGEAGSLLDRGTRYVSFWGVEHRVPPWESCPGQAFSMLSTVYVARVMRPLELFSAVWAQVKKMGGRKRAKRERGENDRPFFTNRIW